MRRDRGVPALIHGRLFHLLGLRRAHRFHPLQDFGIPAVALGGGGDDDQVAHHLADAGSPCGSPRRRRANSRRRRLLRSSGASAPRRRHRRCARDSSASCAAPCGRVPRDRCRSPDARATADRSLAPSSSVAEPSGQYHDRLALAVDLVVDAQALGSVGVALTGWSELLLLLAGLRLLGRGGLHVISAKAAPANSTCTMERGMVSSSRRNGASTRHGPRAFPKAASHFYRALRLPSLRDSRRYGATLRAIVSNSAAFNGMPLRKAAHEPRGSG